MMSLSIIDDLCERGYHISDIFLAPETHHALCSLIRQEYQSDQFQPAKIGQHKAENKTIRNDQIRWLDSDDPHPGLAAYFSKIQTLMALFNRHLFLGLHDLEAHFAVYQAQNFYKKHVDQFKNTQSRRISCVFYLNETWKKHWGGELVIYPSPEQPPVQIAPQPNRFVCFRSDLLHEVLLAHHTRYSIAAWLKVRNLQTYEELTC